MKYYALVFICLSALLFSSCSGKAEKREGIIYPGPKEKEVGENYINISEIKVIEEDVNYNVLAELRSFLRENGIKESKNAKVKLFIGKNGSDKVKAELLKVGLNPQEYPEGYVLYAKDDTIILSAEDDRGLFYAVQTLKKHVSGK